MSHARTTQALVLAVFALAAGAVLAGCGGGGSASPATTGGAAGASATKTAPPMSGKGQTVVVTETDFKLAFSTTSLKPGPVTFEAKNMGKVAHSLEVVGPGVSHKRIAGTIQPGSTGTLSVTLQRGTYEVYCPVDSHKSLGMVAHLAVGGAAAGSGSSGASTGGGTTTSGGGGGGY